MLPNLNSSSAIVSNKLYKIVQIVMPANDTGTAKINFDNNSEFTADELRGNYTTLDDNAGSAKDNGVCKSLIKLRSSNQTLDIFDDFCPSNLILSGGRVKSAEDVTAEKSDQLFESVNVQLHFPKTSTLWIDWKNEHDYENVINIVLRGQQVTELR